MMKLPKLTTETMFSSRSLSPILGSESDVSVHAKYNNSEELEEESD